MEGFEKIALKPSVGILLYRSILDSNEAHCLEWFYILIDAIDREIKNEILTPTEKEKVVSEIRNRAEKYFNRYIIKDIMSATNGFDMDGYIANTISLKPDKMGKNNDN